MNAKITFICRLIRSIDPKRVLALVSMQSSMILALIFIALTPITEWPDATVNISRAADGINFYPPNSAHLNNLIEKAEQRAHFFFADDYKFNPKINYYWINFERLPIIILMILVIYSLKKIVQEQIMPLAPPLIFSLCNPGQEAIATFFLVCAFLISSKEKILTVLLCIVSIILDRSMVPSAAFIILITISPFLNFVTHSPKWLIPILLILVCITQKYSALEVINFFDAYEYNILGISGWEIRYSADYGKNNLFALTTSLMGLYGWMSTRPYPFWLYYASVGILFIIGFTKSNWSTRSFFMSVFFVSYLTMWLLPPISQARYYPILIIAFWGLVISGAQAIKINLTKVYTMIILSTCIGCLVALFKNYTPEL